MILQSDKFSQVFYFIYYDIVSYYDNSYLYKMIHQLEQAFQHFIDNIYYDLETDEYKQSIRTYISRFRTHGLNNGAGSLGTAKALDILGKFGYSIGQYPSVDKAKEYYEKSGK